MYPLTTKIAQQYEQFVLEVEKFEKGNKAAGVRARKATLEITKLMKAWRAESTK